MGVKSGTRRRASDSYAAYRDGLGCDGVYLAALAETLPSPQPYPRTARGRGGPRMQFASAPVNLPRATLGAEGRVRGLARVEREK